MHDPIVIPDPRAVARHALPNVLEGKVVPLVLFVAFLEFMGSTWALLIALGWSLAMVGYRTATGRRVSGLIVLTTAGLTARTIAALATGSMAVYFLQPTVTTVLVGLTFMISVPLGCPLARRLAYDLFPFDDVTKSHPLLHQFFVRLSLLWSITSLMNASFTVWLLVTQSTTTFVLVKSVLGPMTGVLTVGTMFLWFRMDLAKSGTPLVWAKARPAPGQPRRERAMEPASVAG